MIHKQIYIIIHIKKKLKYAIVCRIASRCSNYRSLRNSIGKLSDDSSNGKITGNPSANSKIHIRNWISVFETVRLVKVWSRKGLVNSYRPVACRGKASATNTCNAANETSLFQLTGALNLLTKPSRSDEIDPQDRLRRVSLRKIVKLARSGKSV